MQLSDLINFLAVAFFVVVGVGIYFHANLWPDDQLMWSGDWTDWRIWTIVYYPYWQLYAEMNMGILEGIGNIHVKNLNEDFYVGKYSQSVLYLLRGKISKFR